MSPGSGADPGADAAVLPALFGRALELHRSGRLAEAERAYRLWLAARPGHFDALHLLGLLSTQTGRPGQGVELITQALQLRPDVASAHGHLGLAQQALGWLPEALASFDRALVLDPADADALANRGNLLLRLNRPAEALASLDRAVAVAPERAAGHYNRALALKALGRIAEALGSVERAIVLEPGLADAHHNRAKLLGLQGRAEEAMAALDRALVLAPDHADALDSRAALLLGRGRVVDALRDAGRLLGLRGAGASAHVRMAQALAASGRDAAALDAFEQALALDPGATDAWVGCGHQLWRLGRLPRAQACYGHALALAPARADAAVGHAVVLQAQGQLPQALEGLRSAAVRSPTHDFLAGEVLHAQLQLGDWAGLDEALRRIEQGLRVRHRVAMPFIALSLFDDPELQRLAAEIHAQARSRADEAGNGPSPSPGPWQGRRLRVGYFAADFREHASMRLLARVLELHDRAAFEWHAFSFGPAADDPMRHRVAQAFDAFHDVAALGDADIVRLARAIGLDVAVDLMGCTRHARQGLFARGCAPVQVGFLGHPGTLGTASLHYLIADRVAIPPEQRPSLREQIVHLPQQCLPGDPTRAMAEPGPSRADEGLPADGLVWCCFNASHKIQPSVFDAWMRILRAVDGSVLWLLQAHEQAARNLRREAEARGVDGRRLVFARRCPPDRHLARHRLADLLLDTWPYGAHTGASDALWAGLPVLTRAGRTWPARVAASLLHAAGLPELVVTTVDGYVHLAVELGRDPLRLAALRSRVERARRESPLFDAERFARKLESAYRTMVMRQAAGLEPEDFDVPG